MCWHFDVRLPTRTCPVVKGVERGMRVGGRAWAVQAWRTALVESSLHSVPDLHVHRNSN